MGVPLVPVFKNCCFYYPLRTGLLIWGYLNILFYCLTDSAALVTCFHRIIYHYHRDDYYADIRSIVIMFFITVALAGTNLIFNIVFIVGAHKKHITKIKAFIYFSIFKLILYTSFLVVGNILYHQLDAVAQWMIRYLDPITFNCFIEIPVVATLDIIFHLYLLLLLRSLYISIKEDSEQLGFIKSFEYEVNFASKSKVIDIHPQTISFNKNTI